MKGTVPTVDTTYRYISGIFRGARYSPECNIITLVYINRISTTHRIPLTMSNWRSLWLVSVILAQKVWDDIPLRTSSFTKIVPAYSKRALRDMESKALDLLQYLTSVKPSLYAKYYFELRQLFTEIMGFQESEWGVKPLGPVEAKRLEHRTKVSEENHGAKSSHKRSSGQRDRRHSSAQEATISADQAAVTAAKREKRRKKKAAAASTDQMWSESSSGGEDADSDHSAGQDQATLHSQLDVDDTHASGEAPWNRAKAVNTPGASLTYTHRAHDTMDANRSLGGTAHNTLEDVTRSVAGLFVIS